MYVSTHPPRHCKLTTYDETNICTPAQPQRPPSPAHSAPKLLPFVCQFFSIFLPLWQHKIWTTAWVHGAFPIPHDPPYRPAVLGQTHLKQTLPAGIYKYVYTRFLIQAPNQPCKRWENPAWDPSNPSQNSSILFYEFCTLVELLSDTVLFLNLNFFEGTLCHCWENLYQFTQGGGRGPKAL